jgi:hypothetical protein
MVSTEGFTRVDRIDPTRCGAYGGILDIEFGREDGHDLEELTRVLVEDARLKMDALGVPESRRLICIDEFTNPMGRKLVCVQCADSESPPHDIRSRSAT